MRRDLRLVLIADTHNQHEKIAVPDGDVLVHAGDLSYRGELADVEVFDEWLGGLPHRHKIVIAGNHDFCFENRSAEARARLTNSIYLQDEGVCLEGIRFWGTPWQPWFYDWAFNLHRGTPELCAKWAMIPDDTDVLISHGPPLGHGDRTTLGESAGCADLLDRVQEIRPQVHCFGHIHEGYGINRSKHTLFVNASVCTVAYEPVNPPVVLVFRDGRFERPAD